MANMRAVNNAVPLITQALKARSGQNVHLRKCFGTPGLASRPCSIGEEEEEEIHYVHTASKGL